MFILWWWDYEEAEVLGVYATSQAANKARREWPFHVKQLPEPLSEWIVYINDAEGHERWWKHGLTREAAERFAAKPKRSEHMGITEHAVLP